MLTGQPYALIIANILKYFYNKEPAALSHARGVTGSYLYSVLKFLVTRYLTVNRQGDSVGYLWVVSCKADV